MCECVCVCVWGGALAMAFRKYLVDHGLTDATTGVTLEVGALVVSVYVV